MGATWTKRLFDLPVQGLELWQWLGLGIVLAGAVSVGWVVERLVLAVAGRLARLTTLQWDDQLVLAARGPLWLALWGGLLTFGVGPLALPPSMQGGMTILSHSLVVVSFAWFLLRAVTLLSGVVERAVTDESNRVNARSVRTQLAVMRRVVSAVVYVVSAALLLMQFAVVRTVGLSLLASAGVAGLVLGLAAQKSIGTLLAGIQLSITQPIRMGDSVVVEGESGAVEEINLTYAVVRIWDLRRLVVPITYFLDKPFQNWSKGPPTLLGTVLLQVDYGAPVEAFRSELRRVLEGEGKALWDGGTAQVQVTDASDHTQTLRFLVSARDSGASFDLRCLVRERMVALLAATPAWLPRTRDQQVS